MLFSCCVDLHRGVGEPAWRQLGWRHGNCRVVPGWVSQDLPLHAGLHASRLWRKHEDCRKRGPLHGNGGASQWHVNTWMGVGLGEEGAEEQRRRRCNSAIFFKHPEWHVAELPKSLKSGTGPSGDEGVCGVEDARGGGSRKGEGGERIKWPFYFFNLADDYSLTEN